MDSYLKRQRKQRAQTSEQFKSEKRNNEDYDACDEADNSNRQNAKCNPEDNDMYSNQDYEELGRRAQRKIRNKKRIVHEKTHSEEDSDEEYDRPACKVWKKNEVEKIRTTAKQNVKCNPEYKDIHSDQDYEELGRRAQRKIRNTKKIAQEKKHCEEDSDEEYDRLAHKVWKKNEVEKTRARAKKQNTRESKSNKEYSKLVSEGFNKECNRDIMESNNREISDNDTEDKCEEEIYDEEESANNSKNESFECVEISDSDESQKLDPDYLCSEESDLDTCTQSDTSIASSSLSKACEGLLTELIEVIGEEKISEGSFLDHEQDWRRTVKEFKERRLAQGHAFKTTLESAEELTQVNKDSLHEAFDAVLDGDESDDDEALDTNWVPSDCEVNENEKIKTKDQAGSRDLGMGTLLTEFYKWLTDVDGGYRSEKMAHQ